VGEVGFIMNMNLKNKIKSYNIMKLLSFFVAGASPALLGAEEEQLQAASMKSGFMTVAACPLSGMASLTHGMMPEYFRDSGRYVEMAGSLSCKQGPWGGAVGITQKLTYIETPTEPHYETLQPSDTTLSYRTAASKAPWLVERNLSLLGQIAASLPLSRRSREEGLNSKLSLAAPLSLRKDAASFGITPGLSYFFYDTTLNEEGRANARFSETLSFSGSYQATNSLGVSYTYTLIETTPYESYPKRYLFATDFSLSYDYDAYNIFSGLTSTNDQIKEGKRTKWRPYDKEVTEFYVGVSRPF
jgi:hypothetical protein